jgi:hypothetical protein
VLGIAQEHVEHRLAGLEHDRADAQRRANEHRLAVAEGKALLAPFVDDAGLAGLGVVEGGVAYSFGNTLLDLGLVDPIVRVEVEGQDKTERGAHKQPVGHQESPSRSLLVLDQVRLVT